MCSDPFVGGKKALRKMVDVSVEGEWTANEDVTNSVTCFISRISALFHAKPSSTGCF